MKRIVQMIPSHHARDAAGAEVIYIESLFRSFGWQIETYADNIDEELKGRTRPSSELEISDPRGTIALYHFCVSSDMSYQFRDLPCSRAMIYHNVTPAKFYEPYDAAIAEVCRLGRQQMKDLAPATDLAIAHSEYSRLELESAGYRTTRMIPFLLDRERTGIEPDAEFINKLKGRPNVLFVGRMAPNKKPDDFIRVAKAYFEKDRTPVRFLLAGKRNVLPPFTREIDALLKWADLNEDQLLVTDEVTDAELMACFKAASVFLSMSLHEGFCVPLLESMQLGVPVLARAAAAVPETIGNAGSLFETSDYNTVAELVENLVSDEERRQTLIERGYNRLEHFDPEKWAFVLRVLFERFAAE